MSFFLMFSCPSFSRFDCRMFDRTEVSSEISLFLALISSSVIDSFADSRIAYTPLTSIHCELASSEMLLFYESCPLFRNSAVIEFAVKNGGILLVRLETDIFQILDCVGSDMKLFLIVYQMFACRDRTDSFVSSAIEFWLKFKTSGHALVAQDGVHPNERGYAAFGEHIANEMADVMSLNPAKISWARASKRMSVVTDEVAIPEWA